MTSIRWWDPTLDLLEAHRSMDRLFDQFFGPGGAPAPAGDDGKLPTYQLPVDILETEDGYSLTAAVPGFAPEQVEVMFEEGILSIVASAEPVSAQGAWLRRERPYGSLVRKLQLPQQVAVDKIVASFENGLLTVTVPKVARSQPIKIGIGGTQKQLSGTKS
jgi:HSP20 family protein